MVTFKPPWGYPAHHHYTEELRKIIRPLRTKTTTMTTLCIFPFTPTLFQMFEGSWNQEYNKYKYYKDNPSFHPLPNCALPKWELNRGIKESIFVFSLQHISYLSSSLDSQRTCNFSKLTLSFCKIKDSGWAGMTELDTEQDSHKQMPRCVCLDI